MAAFRNQDARPTNEPAPTHANDAQALAAIAHELRRIADAMEHRLGATASQAASTAADAVATQPALPPAEEALFQSLREWRAGEARKLGMPSYIVATDKVLRAVANAKPASVDDLREIPGLGPAKTAKYGDGILAVVAGTPAPAAEA